jgi:4-hydroxy-tetrahydrodipicolinate reductase
MKTLHVGLGPIGRRVVQLAAALPDVEIVGGVDTDPAKAASDLAALTGAPIEGVSVTTDARETLLATRPDVTVLCTGSRLADLLDDIVAAAEVGSDVVSTSEQLVYPWLVDPDGSERIDQLAREGGITVLGVGVNPGFVMDGLAVYLSAVSTSVRSISVTRVVDVSRRRSELQHKMGVGLSLDAFAQRVASATLGHVGLRQSAELIATKLGWSLGTERHVLEPVVTDGAAVRGTRERLDVETDVGSITLELVMDAEAEDPRDEIVIDAVPPVHGVLRGGVFGDDATAAIVLNYLPVVSAADAGLVTIADLPMAGAWSGRHRR